jgi:hypothetical protein
MLLLMISDDDDVSVDDDGPMFLGQKFWPVY